MKCKICFSFLEIADKSSSLFIGDGAFRCTTIQAHLQSKTYCKCFEANSAQENPDGAPLWTVLRNMNARVWMHKSKKNCKSFSTVHFYKQSFHYCKIQMNCSLVEHCPENKMTQVCEECPNYSYFIPSKLWKQLMSQNEHWFNHNQLHQWVKTNQREQRFDWLYYALYQLTSLRSPQQKPMYC